LLDSLLQEIIAHSNLVGRNVPLPKLNFTKQWVLHATAWLGNMEIKTRGGSKGS